MCGVCVSVCVCRSLTDLCRNQAESIAGGSTEETDVIVVGSGVAGLSCAAILSRYGYKVNPFT